MADRRPRQHTRRGTPPPVVRRRARREGHQGQTTIEFAFTFVLLLVCLFGTIGMGIWAVESMDSTAGLEDFARIGVGTANVGSGAATPDLQNTGPWAAELTQVKLGMFGTSVNYSNDDSLSRCASLPSSLTANICAEYRNDPSGIAIAGSTSYLVTVEVTACANTLVPTFARLGGCYNGIPIREVAAIHALTFTG